MHSISFLPLHVPDAPTPSAVALQAYRDHYLHFWHDQGAWYMEYSFSPEQLAKELADPNAQYFLVQVNNAPVGFIKINIDKGLDDYSATDSMELERIYLIKEATGHGVGQAAIQFVQRLAAERHKKILWLKSMDTSPALGFYKRAGFQVHSTLRLSFEQMKEELRGMVVLQRQVNNEQPTVKTAH